MGRVIPLGGIMKVACYAFKGDLPVHKGREMSADLVVNTKMQPVCEPFLHEYPIDNDKGGVGYTLYQPITESFITIDVYTELYGGYVLVSSCEPYFNEQITKTLEAYGLTIVDNLNGELSIEPRSKH